MNSSFRSRARASSPEGAKNPASATRTRSPPGKAGMPGPQRPPVSQASREMGGPVAGRQSEMTKKGSVVEKINQITVSRDQRRKAAEEVRKNRESEAAQLDAQCGGRAPDIDFHRMIKEFRLQCPAPSPIEPLHVKNSGNADIFVTVRKRPIMQHELQQRDLDCVTTCNPVVIVHESKFKVDGITKYLESTQFEFDRLFDETVSSSEVYDSCCKPLLPWVVSRGGRATLFAYGQTGSGKTYTMLGLQHQLSGDIFKLIQGDLADKLQISVSFFEIYGGRPYDLLNNRSRLETLEDNKNEVQIQGLSERETPTPGAMLQCIELGNSMRTTHATSTNQDSSRSHAICVVFFRTTTGAVHGKITLVDLAGSERAAESKSHIRQRRVEGGQINKSLLALKECIRAMSSPGNSHVPFRASKLTLVLRDSFVSKVPTQMVMIACVSPGISSADHSINTLRYSDRLKDRPKVPIMGRQSAGDDSAVERQGASASSSAATAGEGGQRQQRSFWGPLLSKDGRRPESSQRKDRSPSPPPPGNQLPSRAKSTNASAPELPVEEGAGELGGDQHADDDRTPHASAPGADAAARTPTSTASASSGRQTMPRRGRQPTLGQPNRPAQGMGRSTNEGGSVPPRNTGLADRGILSPRTGGATHGPGGGSSASAGGTSTKAVKSNMGTEEEADVQYLHTALTQEVAENQTTPVDVGVAGPEDIAHMEALEEVRRLEDQILSQHMVALQEDARLLTAESELLSQVQQSVSYDIDWYVGEVDRVVRRKMEVYQAFLDQLDAFKAQLRREETLSRSCQRPRGVGNLNDGATLSPRGGREGAEQRTPRSPRRGSPTGHPAGGPVAAWGASSPQKDSHAATGHLTTPPTMWSRS